METFASILENDYGFKSGKNAPMAPPPSTSGGGYGGLRKTVSESRVGGNANDPFALGGTNESFRSYGRSSYPTHEFFGGSINGEDFGTRYDDDVFGSVPKTSPGFDDLLGGSIPTMKHGSLHSSTRGSDRNHFMRSSSEPILDDVFGEGSSASRDGLQGFGGSVPEVKLASKPIYDGVFDSGPQVSLVVDDLLGEFEQPAGKVKPASHHNQFSSSDTVDELITGFGLQANLSSSVDTKADTPDPFVPFGNKSRIATGTSSVLDDELLSGFDSGMPRTSSADANSTRQLDPFLPRFDDSPPASYSFADGFRSGFGSEPLKSVNKGGKDSGMEDPFALIGDEAASTSIPSSSTRVDDAVNTFSDHQRPSSEARRNGANPGLLDSFHSFPHTPRNSTSFRNDMNYPSDPVFSPQPKVTRDSIRTGSSVHVDEMPAQDLASSDDQRLHRGSAGSEGDLGSFFRHSVSSASNEARRRPPGMSRPTVLSEPRIPSSGSASVDEWASSFAQGKRGRESGSSSRINSTAFVDDGLLSGFEGIKPQSSSRDENVFHQSDPFANNAAFVDDGLLSGFEGITSRSSADDANVHQFDHFVPVDDTRPVSTLTSNDDELISGFSTEPSKPRSFQKAQLSPTQDSFVSFNDEPVSSSNPSASTRIDDPFNLFGEPQHPSSGSSSGNDVKQDPFDSFDSFVQAPQKSTTVRDESRKSVGNKSGAGTPEKTTSAPEFFYSSQASREANSSGPFFSTQSEVRKSASGSGLSKETPSWDFSSSVNHGGFAGSENDLESFFGRPVSSAPRQGSASMNDSHIFGEQRRSSSVPVTTSANVDEWTSIFAPSQTSKTSQGDPAGTSSRAKRMQESRNRASKAIDEFKLREQEAQREQAERQRAGDLLDVQIKRWANGKEGNLRALLSSVQDVLWPDCGWTPVSLPDLIDPMAVKKIYRKATLYVHPDKVQQKGATVHQKYIAEKVFDLLKEAWKKFNSEELF